MTEPKGVLLIFTKNPEKGKVKTRLAATVGDDRALLIYKSLLAHTRGVAKSISAKRLLFYSETIAKDDAWASTDFEKHLQHSGDLGERISAAFETGFQEGGPVLIIGSDCPQLSASIVNDAFAALKKHDFVLGPAMDGGYYLLGMQAFSPSLFQDIAWSTAEVAQETRKKIEILGASCHELPILSDIDYEEDWEKYGWKI